MTQPKQEGWVILDNQDVRNFVTLYGRSPNEFWDSGVAKKDLKDLLIKQAELTFRTEIEKAKQEVAQDCYLQCLAVECGEGECSEAIKSKYKLNS